MLTCNVGYWKLLATAGPQGAAANVVFLACMFVLSVGLINLLLLILSSVFTTRPTLAVALLVAAPAGYFTAAYATLFDREMLRNVIETNASESFELLSLPLLATILLAGIVPAVLILRNRYRKRGIRAAVGHKVVAVAAALMMIAVPVSAQQKEIFSSLRNNHELRHMIAPLNVLSAGVSLTRQYLRKPVSFTHIADDATHVSSQIGAARPTVHVLMIGETARASNFSLAGYERTTNPQLEGRDDLFFAVADSCGTATAVSVPCMFSAQDRVHFNRTTSDNQDNLLDIAARAGYDVHWFDNGNSCKGVCARVDFQPVQTQHNGESCEDTSCYDDILVSQLRAFLPTVTSDTVVVLHGLGSHGPKYYLRYPEQFRAFQPDCSSSSFGNCTPEEIINAYDNTILYTDHVIASVIDALADFSDQYDVSMVYVSDHGESLGEHGLYLHGMPYGLAPAEQTQVPLIAWFGQGGRHTASPSSQCQPDGADDISHDNLIHTELGLLGISTALYDPDLDLFSACRSLTTAADAS